VAGYFDKPLFIFEMANNHMGSVSHGLNMIKAFAEVKKTYPFQFAFKFQFRQIETFIHPEYRSKTDHAYVTRFSETSLGRDQFLSLKQAVSDRGFISICTPFDEPSVDLIVDLDIDIIKVASCSFTDWPLLEKIVTTDKPVILSTAGTSLNDIDRVVSFFSHREKAFAILHCVGEYPTDEKNLQLNQIDLLKKRYAEIPIGFSTHEEPDNTNAIQIAVAKGSVIFERHVALETKEWKKNAYSSTPEQIQKWLDQALSAFNLCGTQNSRAKATQKEIADLHQFRRGTFASVKIRAGEKITMDNTFFAFPNKDGQIVANDMSKYMEMKAVKNFEPNEAIMKNGLTITDTREKVFEIVSKVKEIFTKNRMMVPGHATLEISHHFGMDRFYETGCVIVTIINREYCKKLIILFPGQKHPEQFHKLKEETFMLLHGEISLILDGVEQKHKQGDIITVNRGTKHAFSSETGSVIEEISSTHYSDDSYYTDHTILENKDRKTVLSYWA